MPTSGGMSAGGDRQAPTKSLYILYLEVKAVVNNRRVDSLLQSGVAAQGEDDFSPLQLSFIREIYKEKEPLAVLSEFILLYPFVGIARQTSSFVSPRSLRTSLINPINSIENGQSSWHPPGLFVFSRT